MDIGITRVRGPYFEYIENLPTNAALKVVHVDRLSGSNNRVWVSIDCEWKQITVTADATGNTLTLTTEQAADTVQESVQLTINGVSTPATFNTQSRVLTVAGSDSWSNGDTLVIRLLRNNGIFAINPPKDVTSVGLRNGDAVVVQEGIQATFDYNDRSHVEHLKNYYNDRLE